MTFLRDDTGSNLTFGEEGDDRISSINTFSGAELNGADPLIGGIGNDTLLGDAGDLLYGGAGEDTFNVFGNGDAASVIADFDIDEDVLIVSVWDQLSSSLTYTYDAAADGVIISNQGEIVTFLHGVQADQIATLRDAATVEVYPRF